MTQQKIKIPVNIAKLPIAGLREKLIELGVTPTASRNKPYLQRLVAKKIAERAAASTRPRGRGPRARQVEQICEDVNQGRVVPQEAPSRAPRPEPRPASPSPAPSAPRGRRHAADASKVDPRLPPVGGTLEREIDGKKHVVTILAGGLFSYRGETYKSLSQIAKVATGTIWNGFLFFKLTPYPKRKRAAA